MTQDKLLEEIEACFSGTGQGDEEAWLSDRPKLEAIIARLRDEATVARLTEERDEERQHAMAAEAALAAMREAAEPVGVPLGYAIPAEIEMLNSGMRVGAHIRSSVIGMYTMPIYRAAPPASAPVREAAEPVPFGCMVRCRGDVWVFFEWNDYISSPGPEGTEIMPLYLAAPPASDAVREALKTLGGKLWMDANRPWRIMIEKGRSHYAICEMHTETVMGDGDENMGEAICTIVNAALAQEQTP